MSIVQMLPSLTFGDAIGNDAMAIHDLLKRKGYESNIYAVRIDKKLSLKYAKKIEEYSDKEDNIILYHLAIGDELNEMILAYKARLVIIYHNITPPSFLYKYNRKLAIQCSRGLKEAKKLASRADLCIADSKYNKTDLLKLGYSCPIEVCPVFMRLEDFNKKGSKAVIDRYDRKDIVKIIFVGRIAPNKKQEDIITSFYYYQTFINPKSELFLVGGYENGDKYFRCLRNYVRELELENVHFTGKISFSDLISYYSLADIFLCLSEHEGFCVPIVEAMYFGIPIIAYDSSAVGETIGDGGLLLDDKDPRLVAEAIDLIAKNDDIRNKIVRREKNRLLDFDPEIMGERFMRYISEFL